MQRTALAAALLAALALTACKSTESTAMQEEAPRGAPLGASAESEDKDAEASVADQALLAQPAPQSPREAAAKAAAGNAAPSSNAQERLERVQVTGSRVRRADTSGTLPARELAFAPPAPPAPPPPPIPVQAMPVMSMPTTTGLIGQPAAVAPTDDANTEKYAERSDNPVHRASETPVSTFSIDVDTGSYSNVRRMLRANVRPPADAVRAEEMLNYFDYNHPGPTALSTPFRTTTELAPAPWNGKRQLLMIGIKGYDLPKAELPPSNLVFLIDTSGSMQSEDKLPLLKASFAQLVEQLRPQDKVTLVVYAGSAGVVLEPTSGSEKETILGALDRLQAGGSTNGGAGIQLAYAMAKQAFIPNGVNRVILATDGDFNVGTTNTKALETLVGDQRKHGIALTTLGFGQGNYNDHMAERLADVGDGNHAYIDTLQEARKVLVREMQSTLLTIAKDVKIQIEFNPALVAEYRLIGYENRLLAREDFANDKVDAGDIGAGHEVTALYELTLVGSGAERLPALRYGDAKPAAAAGKAGELAHLRLRYKRPGEDTSRLIETPILRSALRPQASPTLRFAASVAAYADALRGGKHLENWTWEDIARAARDGAGRDPWRERAEFIGLIDSARRLTGGGDTPVAQIAE